MNRPFSPKSTYKRKHRIFGQGKSKIQAGWWRYRDAFIEFSCFADFRHFLTHLDLNGRAVAEHLCYARSDFVRIVAHADDRVRSNIIGMLDHQFISVRSGFFAQLGIERDVSAKEGLKSGADVANEAARPHHNPPNDPEVPDCPMPRQLKCRGNFLEIHAHPSFSRGCCLDKIQELKKCRRQDLNLHCPKATSPSSWRVCQFRHSGLGTA